MVTRSVYLARHGETDWNAAGRWQGHTDVPLNATGEAQARGMARVLRGVGLGAVVSSDLRRARETARIVAGMLGLDIAYVDPDLRERAFGPFEGLTREDCERLHADAWQAWVERRHPPEGAESQDALTTRVVAAVARAADAADRFLSGAGPGAGAGAGQRSGAPTLIVTHGGSLRAAVSAAVGRMPAPVKNGAVWRFEVKGGAILAAEPLLPG